MLKILLVFLASATLNSTPDTTSNGEISDLLQKAEERFEHKEEQDALEIYLDILEHDSEHFEALWNASLNYSRVGFRFDDEDRQKEYFKEAIDLAEKAVELYPDRGKSHYVKAVAVGRMADVAGTRERISSAHTIRESIEKAVELNPDYAPAWHLFGVWHSEVANVGRAEKIAARFISKGIPEGASDETAEEYLNKAIELNPDHMLFRLDLARHYLRSAQDEKAIPVLKKILEMEPDLKDDPEYLEEAEELLADLQ